MRVEILEELSEFCSVVQLFVGFLGDEDELGLLAFDLLKMIFELLSLWVLY